MTIDADRLWRMHITISAFIRSYIRQDPAGMKLARRGVLREMDGMELSTELREQPKGGYDSEALPLGDW